MFNKDILKFVPLFLATCHVKGAIFNFDLVLEPSQEFVQYNEAFLRGPGSIDLSNLTFTAISGAYKNDEMYDDFVEATDDEYRTRQLETVGTRQLDGGIEQGASFVDVAIFRLPNNCAQAKGGCDWSALGVGKRGTNGELRWCCSSESVALGLCAHTDEKYGRLIIDKTKFGGELRSVSVPQDGPMSKQIRLGKVNEKKSGTYVVLYANCDDNARQISIKGRSVWKSKHGYLPGELFGFMYFYTFVTFIYGALFFWFAFLMSQNKDTRIEIEKWIVFAIGLGLLEMIFRSGDYYVWNGSGHRSSFIIWIGIMIGVLKQGMSRCLAVMVSMGWGVSRDSLSTAARAMSVGLAIAYIFISALSDCLIVFAVENMSTLSYREEKGIVSFVNVLRLLQSLVDTIFIVWVLMALSKSIKYLESNNEKTKLTRMEQLRNIFIGAVSFAVICILFSVFDRYKEGGIVAEEHAWAKDAASEVNYLFVLIGIAMLWRPNESAQNYAYFKELSPMYYDDEEEDLELSDMNG